MAYLSVLSIPLTVRSKLSAIVSGRAVDNALLSAQVLIPRTKPRVAFDAHVDTGATLSVFGADVWSRFAQQITWLTAAEEAQIPGWLRAVADASGHVIPARLGRARIQLVYVMRPPLHAIESYPVELVAMFVRPNGLRHDDMALLGLNGGLYDHVRLVVEPGLESARFEQLL